LLTTGHHRWIQAKRHAVTVRVPMRTLQEWMRHRDYTTTLIYADFAPDPSGGAAFAEQAFGDPMGEAGAPDRPAAEAS